MKVREVIANADAFIAQRDEIRALPEHTHGLCSGGLRFIDGVVHRVLICDECQDEFLDLGEEPTSQWQR